MALRDALDCNFGCVKLSRDKSILWPYSKLIRALTYAHNQPTLHQFKVESAKINQRMVRAYFEGSPSGSNDEDARAWLDRLEKSTNVKSSKYGEVITTIRGCLTGAAAQYVFSSCISEISGCRVLVLGSAVQGDRSKDDVERLDVNAGIDGVIERINGNGQSYLIAFQSKGHGNSIPRISFKVEPLTVYQKSVLDRSSDPKLHVYSPYRLDVVTDLSKVNIDSPNNLDRIFNFPFSQQFLRELETTLATI